MAAVHNAGERWGIVRFIKGQHLFKQNEPSRDLFIIKSGSVLIYKNEGNTRIELDTVGPGAVIGEIAPTEDGGIRSTSGVAIEETETILIPAADFQAILARVPEYFSKNSPHSCSAPQGGWCEDLPVYRWRSSEPCINYDFAYQPFIRNLQWR
jgi:signal-transduction protein with cAMP-binding, CBS, and nucleotidyltransferase domain